MKVSHVITLSLLMVGSVYFASKAQKAKTRGTRIRDEIISDALSLTSNFLKM